MNTLYKQCGKEVKVNDNSLAHALSLGWTKKKPDDKKQPTKKSK